MRLPAGYRGGALLLVAATIWLAIDGRDAAQQNYDDENTPEGWAWAQIKQGKEANFDVRCGTPTLDPTKDDDHWNDKCRRISAAFIGDVLTREPWHSQIPLAGVNIVGARIEGNIDLINAGLNRLLSITRSRIERDVNLNRARTDSLIVLDGSRVAGDVWADQLRSESSLWLRSAILKRRTWLAYGEIDVNVELSGAIVQGTLNADGLQVGRSLSMDSTAQNKSSFKDVTLIGAKVGGQLSLEGATVEGTLSASELQVGNSLLMSSTERNKSSFKDVILRAAKVGGQVNLTGASVEGTLDADGLQLGQSLFMGSTEQNKGSFKNVILIAAKVGGQVSLKGATVEGALNASELQVGNSLFMNSTERNKATFSDVNLRSAKVAGQVDMDGATFDGPLDAERLEVGTDFYMRNVTNKTHTVDLSFAHVNGRFDLRRASLSDLNLSGASASDLALDDATVWRANDGTPGRLILRNTRIVNLMDAKTAWPDPGYLTLDGFTFAHLGGVPGEGSAEMRGRGAVWWDEWVRRDRVYNPASYEQLATAFVAAGDRSSADEIRYLGRIRQREEEKQWWPWLSSLVFQYTAGFGIGDYTFRVLYWVTGVSFVGALYLWARVPAARQHGPVWCCGASLSRLLPIIEINKEFTDFFDDPARKRLTGFDSFFFSVIAMVGWLLGAILIAAVSGLVPKG
jgi:uncharacterized protein YjbI with pentapeptide repeats